MSFLDILPAIRGLSRSDKFRLIQAIADDLAREDGIRITSGEVFPVWSPHNAHEAAEALLEALRTRGAAE